MTESINLPPAACEEDVRSYFTKAELSTAADMCAGCKWGHHLARVYGVAYFHKGTDGLGGFRPCQARHHFQEIVRSRKV